MNAIIVLTFFDKNFPLYPTVSLETFFDDYYGDYYVAHVNPSRLVIMSDVACKITLYHTSLQADDNILNIYVKYLKTNDTTSKFPFLFYFY